MDVGHKLAFTSMASTAAGLAMDSANVIQTHLGDVTQVGQAVSIIVSIVSGIVSLFKLLRKRKKDATGRE